MSYDFTAELRLTAAFAKTRPASPLALGITFRDYPEFVTRAELRIVGEKGAVEAMILAQDFFAGRLRPEMVFDGAVGGQAVARGIVTAVANEALALGEGTHPDSVNLHRYPADIRARIDADFGPRAAIAFREIQEAIGQTPSVRQPRIIRGIVWLAGGDLRELDLALDLAVRDYRDVLVAAEYAPSPDGEPTRLRDLTHGF